VLKGSTQEKYALGELKTRRRDRRALRSPGPGLPGHQGWPPGRHGGRQGWKSPAASCASPRARTTATFVGPELYDSQVLRHGAGIGIAQGPRRAEEARLNAAIKAIRANGTYKKINDKYFNFDVYGK
jgi:arginine/ornithine transport system substrate-binding protein